MIAASPEPLNPQTQALLARLQEVDPTSPSLDSSTRPFARVVWSGARLIEQLQEARSKGESRAQILSVSDDPGLTRDREKGGHNPIRAERLGSPVYRAFFELLRENGFAPHLYVGGGSLVCIGSFVAVLDLPNLAVRRLRLLSALDEKFFIQLPTPARSGWATGVISQLEVPSPKASPEIPAAPGQHVKEGALLRRILEASERLPETTRGPELRAERRRLMRVEEAFRCDAESAVRGGAALSESGEFRFFVSSLERRGYQPTVSLELASDSSGAKELWLTVCAPRAADPTQSPPKESGGQGAEGGTE